ncbi:hypothetical protein [Cryptosporangium sp. NPDC051539]|uniref:hypothetical protein n=1 Tax=Cryptosporangium sp. NPDC051539 TaxID=3363962 RepID=UPI003792A3BF
MLAISKYPQEFVDMARRQIAAQVEAFRKLGSSESVREFEPSYFNNLVLALEMHFVHRTRAVEKKDGNPMNEVRVLAMSLISNNGVLGEDRTIKLEAETSVLGYRVGDVIAIREDQFVALAKAFFDDLETKYV